MTPKHIDTFIDLELRKRAHALSSFLIESRLEWEKLDSIGGARTHTFMEDYLSLWGRFGDQWSALEKQGILTPPEYKIFDAIREVFGNTAAVLNRKCLSEPEQKASLLSKKDDRQGPQFLHREYYMDGVSPSMKKPEITLRDKDTITIILG